MPRRLTILLLLACVAPIAALHAQTAKPLTLTALVAQLDDADYATRLKATQTLLKDDTLDTRVLVSYCEKSVSLEQRHRLIDITLHHVIRQYAQSVATSEGPGAIGTLLLPALSAEQVPDLKKTAVRIGQPRPGFPAYACLLPGDLIVEFGGKPLSSGPEKNDSNLTTSISLVTPGNSVNLGVYRAGAVFNVVIPVYSRNTLLQVYSTDNVSPRTLLPRQWDDFTTQNPKLSVDTVSPSAPPAIDLTTVLKSVPIWSMPAVAGGGAGGALPINRPPPPIPGRNPKPQVEDAEDVDVPIIRE